MLRSSCCSQHHHPLLCSRALTLFMFFIFFCFSSLPLGPFGPPQHAWRMRNARVASCCCCRCWGGGAWRVDRENSCLKCHSRRGRRRRPHEPHSKYFVERKEAWRQVLLPLLPVHLLLHSILLLAACHLTLCFTLHLSPCHKSG